jgi:hypothetical protein
MQQKLGKIAKAAYGLSDGQSKFGLSVTLAFDGSMVDDFKGRYTVRPPHAQYSQESYDQGIVDDRNELARLLIEAKASNVQDLVGKPVEITLEGNLLRSWRILTEVL